MKRLRSLEMKRDEQEKLLNLLQLSQHGINDESFLLLNFSYFSAIMYYVMFKPDKAVKIFSLLIRAAYAFGTSPAFSSFSFIFIFGICCQNENMRSYIFNILNAVLSPDDLYKDLKLNPYPENIYKMLTEATTIEEKDIAVKKLEAFKILDVPIDACNTEIKKAFRRRMLELHPDKNDGRSSPELTQLISAYETLIKAKQEIIVSHPAITYQGSPPSPLRSNSCLTSIRFSPENFPPFDSQCYVS